MNLSETLRRLAHSTGESGIRIDRHSKIDIVSTIQIRGAITLIPT
jgi:hypothetical protein